MSSSPPTRPGREAAQAWFDPRIRLLQPQLPTLAGHHAFRERFAQPLFALIPELHGQVERSAIGADCAYVELTLCGFHPTPLRRPSPPARHQR